jgi:hypothetical protein
VWTWHWREKDLHKKLVVIASAKHAIKRKQLTSPEMWKPKFFSISNDPLTPCADIAGILHAHQKKPKAHLRVGACYLLHMNASINQGDQRGSRKF